MLIFGRVRLGGGGTPGEGCKGTEIRNFIFLEGWFRAGGLETNIGDVNIGGGGGRFRDSDGDVHIMGGLGSFGTDIGDVNIWGSVWGRGWDRYRVC